MDKDEESENDEETDEKAEDQKAAPQPKGEGVKQIVIELLLEGGHSQSEIARVAGCSRQYVHEVKKELKAVGRLG